MTTMERCQAAIAVGAPLSSREIAEMELTAFLHSQRREWMLTGRRYYNVDNDILARRRTVIGEDGVLQSAVNAANNRLAHGFVRELTDQKTQYLLGRDYSLQCEDAAYARRLAELLGARFADTLRRTAKDAICQGIGWLHPYFDENGRFCVKRMEPAEILPFWRDAEHRALDAVMRAYEVEQYAGRYKTTVIKAELWTQKGVEFFRLDNGRLVDEERPPRAQLHALNDDGTRVGFNWARLPFIPVKYNDEELPLVEQIKTLIDEYDRVASNDSNALEDQPNSILVVRNYDGQNLGEFRRNLSVYRAVKVSDDGGLDTLQTPLSVEASNRHLDRVRRDIYAFGRGVDTRSERFQSAASGAALRHEYAQLDLDVNSLERGLHDALAQLQWFAGHALGAGDNPPPVEWVFSRDIVTVESEAIAMCRASQGIISDETIIDNHPWVKDRALEIERLEQ